MAIQSYTTKIVKRLLWAFLIASATVLGASSQSVDQPNACYDSQKKEIILLNGMDSIATISLGKSFKATLNHEKKRKKKTVYFRLAEYSNPVDIAQVPVVISNSDIILHVEGKLRGDTVAEFSCIIKEISGRLTMETRVKDISVGQVSFQINVLPNKFIYVDSPSITDLISMKRNKKRNLIDITIKDGKDLYISFNELR